jgi:hypothetical protein
MKRFYPGLILLLVFLFGSVLFSGCASRRYEKLALKNEQAGLFEDAADLYLQSLAANKDNIDAKIGARKTAQIVLDRKLSDFSSAYSAGKVHDAVFYYVTAKTYTEKFAASGVLLEFPTSYEEQFNEVKNISIEEKYRQGVKLLDDEKFAESEILFKEIIDLESNYKDVNDLYKIAHYEPLYRQGKKLYENKTFRKAYYTFAVIVNETGDYKEALQYRNDALEAATFIVMVNEFEYKQDMKLASKIRNAMIAQMINSDNPFLKVVDASFEKETESKRGKVVESNVKSEPDQGDKKLKNNAILKGKIVMADISNGRLVSAQKKGFNKRTYEVIDKATGVKSTKVEYDKINYSEYNQSNSASCVFSYQLVSAETDEVFVSDEIRLDGNDELHYASFTGETQNIYPGFWESPKGNSPKDLISNSNQDYSNLQRLFAAKRTIKSGEQMMNELVDQIALKSSGAVIRFNPEK